jgi:hypothetical protein
MARALGTNKMETRTTVPMATMTWTTRTSTGRRCSSAPPRAQRVPPFPQPPRAPGRQRPSRPLPLRGTVVGALPESQTPPLRSEREAQGQDGVDRMPAHYERTEEEEEFAQEDEAHACPTGICPVLRFRQHPGMHTVTRAVGQVRYGGPFEEIRDELLAAQNWEQRREILCFLRESAKKKDSRVIGLLRSPPPPPPPPSPPPPPPPPPRHQRKSPRTITATRPSRISRHSSTRPRRRA